MDSLFILITILRIIATYIGYLTMGFWFLGARDLGTFIYYFQLVQ